MQAQIARYEPDDAARVCSWMRRNAGLDAAVEHYVDLYRRIVAEHRAPGTAPDPASEGRDAAAYLRRLDPYLKERAQALIDREELWRGVHALEAHLGGAA